MTQANINERGTCRSECDVTWHDEHGASVPGGPFPGTRGDSGDVRRCEHGAVWLFVETFENGFFCRMDRWRRLQPWLHHRQFRRAMKALEEASSDV